MIVEEYKNFLDKDFINYLSNHYLINNKHQEKAPLYLGAFLPSNFAAI